MISKNDCFYIKLREGVFLRHFHDNSVVWCPHTGGCTVMRDARPILEEVTSDKRTIDEICKAVASKLACGVDDVRDGVIVVVEELVSQRFVEACGTGIQVSNAGICTELKSTNILSGDDDWTPLGDFYKQARLPSELHIDLTDGCNEKCIHCYLPKGGAQYLDKEIVFKVLKEFRSIQGMTVLVSGGECMLHEGFAEILHYAKSLELNIIVMSNLTLCNASMVALLKEIAPQFVNVSLYAVTDPVHDAITQIQGSCKRTKAAIDMLLEAGVPVRIATPFMRENKEYVDELNEYAAERHLHLIASDEIFGQIDHSCKNQDHALTMDELERLIVAHKNIFYKSPYTSVMCGREAKVCDIGDMRLNLDAAGLYYPCDGFHGMIIGDARKDSLLDVWTGEPLKKLRMLKTKDFGACADCADRAWCKICPMRNFNEMGDMLIHSPWRCKKAQIYHKVFGDADGDVGCGSPKRN